MSAGGKAVDVEMTDEMRHIVDLVRPKLLDDGMFLVGLDIVGDKLMEVNVFSPGGRAAASASTEPTSPKPSSPASNVKSTCTSTGSPSTTGDSPRSEHEADL